jgi:hypothetical protein
MVPPRLAPAAYPHPRPGLFIPTPPTRLRLDPWPQRPTNYVVRRRAFCARSRQCRTPQKWPAARALTRLQPMKPSFQSSPDSFPVNRREREWNGELLNTEVALLRDGDLLNIENRLRRGPSELPTDGTDLPRRATRYDRDGADLFPCLRMRTQAATKSRRPGRARRLCGRIIVEEEISVLRRPGSDLLFQVLGLSTIGAGEINGRVRDGIGF